MRCRAPAPRACVRLLLPLLLLPAYGRSADAQPAGAPGTLERFLGQPIAEIHLTLEGRPLDAADLRELLETQTGEPLAMGDVRESMVHLFSLGRFGDLRVDAAAVPGGVRLTYVLEPLHTLAGIAFRGETGVSSGTLRDAVVDRFGATPAEGRAADIAQFLLDFYRRRGYARATAVPSTEVDHEDEETVLVFTVNAGPRARVARIEVVGTPLPTQAAFLDRIGLDVGDAYDAERLERRMSEYRTWLARQGYYEAETDHRAQIPGDATRAFLTLDVAPGPLVQVVFEGDPIPEDDRDDLVPIAREGSIDEDLLEDSTNRIRSYFRERGYWKASVQHRRTALADGRVSVVFTVRKGQPYRVASLEVSGNTREPLQRFAALLETEAGEPFVESRLDRDVAAILDWYRRRGYANVAVDSSVAETTAATPSGEGLVTPRIMITEGPRTLVGSVIFSGSAAIPEAELREGLRATPGQPYYRPTMLGDRDTVALAYLNRGYQQSVVSIDPLFSEDGTRADVVYSIEEGPQILVDHIVIVGNTRTSTATIRNELLIAPGEPLGLDDFLESQRRVRALGLFRRVRFAELQHPERSTRDVIITVEEAPATTIGYGGGIEGGKRLRRAAEGAAEERIEFAPRGFFEVTRRNLWGKNRSISLFTRISFRPADDPADTGGRGFGFNEYRVLGTYREPRALGWNAEASITGLLEQAIRSSFNYSRRQVQAAVARRLSQRVSISGAYSFERNDVFDERYNPDEALLIDRLFPQVRLGTISSALLHDTRDDILDPASGTLIGAEGELAAKVIGSQVGFSKTLLQAFLYRRVPQLGRSVFAAGARIGLGAALPNEVPLLDGQGNPVVGPDGQPVTTLVKEIPASRRFFAGGGTTVRGFALDRLGDESTIDQDGFPRGGNALLMLNAELRFPIWRDLGAVTFLDVGNVFARVTDMDLGDLRGGAGIGLRYRSPIGPVRLDVGFKLDRRTFATGVREDPLAWHIGIGHAF